MTDSRERLGKIRNDMLTLVERQVTSMLTRPRPPRQPAKVERRALANTLGLWQFCGEKTCRRAHCCRGEPRHCLRVALPILPPKMVDGLMQPRRRGRRG